MRRIITLVFSCVCLVSQYSSFAQCTINHSITTPGFSPSSLPCIVQGATYGQSVQFHLPASVTVSGFPATLDSIEIDSIVGMPTGISYTINPGNVPIAGDSNGCVWISGNVNDTIGAFPLTFYAKIWVDGISQPIDTSLNSAGINYALSVCGQSFDTCSQVINFSSHDQLSFYQFTPDPIDDIYGYVAGNNGNAEPTQLAEELTPPVGASLTSVNMAFRYCTINPEDSNLLLNVYIMDNSGANGGPGYILDSASVTLGYISTAVSAYIAHGGGALIIVSMPFNLPIIATGKPVFAVIDLPQIEGDTVALFSTSTTTTDGNAWENVGGFTWDKYLEDFGFNLGLYAYIEACTNQAQPAFTASPTGICAGQPVYFVDQTTGARTSWNWTFEGGNPPNSGDQNPVVSYANSGTYGVTLSVTNPAGTDSAVQSGYITVYPNPVDSIASYTPASSSSSADGAIQIAVTAGTSPFFYYWSNGDSSASVNNLSPGNYQLTITDNNGCFLVDDSLNVSFTTGINPAFAMGQVKIYPNPASEQLNIYWPFNSVANVEVFDASGKVLITATIAQSTTPLNINNLAAGVYMIKLTDRSSTKAQTFIFNKVN